MAFCKSFEIKSDLIFTFQGLLSKEYKIRFRKKEVEK